MGVDVSIYLFNMTEYQERVLPAYDVLVTRGDTGSLIALLNECGRRLKTNPQLSEKLFSDEESIKEAIGILDGTVYYSPDGGRTSNQGTKEEAHKVKRTYASWALGSNVVEILCVPQVENVSSEQDMTHTQLLTHLYAESEWIKDLLTFARSVRGGYLDLPIGESTEVFTKQDLQQFNDELDRIPRPKQPELEREYDNLRAIFKLALENPQLTLVLSVA